MKKVIIILIIALLTPFAIYAQDNGQSTQEPSSGVTEGYNPDYNILPIILTLIMFYLIIYLFYDNRNIKRRTYKQIWSLVLVGSFLFVGISGIILSLLADFNGVLPFNFNLLFWHVEAGVIMAVTSIFHIHIHWKAIKRVFNGKLTTKN